MTRVAIERQMEFYRRGGPSPFPVSPDEWEDRARQTLSPEAFGWVAGGAGAEDTMRANREAFFRWRLRPRMLRDVSERSIATTVLGTPSAAPFLLAPVGVLSIVHPEADLAVARAAAATGVPFVLSNVASTSIEDVAAVMGDAPRWFQVYPGKDPEIIASAIRRAEVAGYSAIVVTLDNPLLGWRVRDLRTGTLPFLRGEGLANYLSDPVVRARLSRPPEEDREAAIQFVLNVFVNPAFSWDGIADIRRRTRLPLLLKGITHPSDARMAVEYGVDGIIVSNHGGRQVDGAVTALDALPEIRQAVGDRVTLLMDSGIRRGADVLKALALGASAVLLGRPYIYGLAVAGEEGVRQVIWNLMAEIELQMALCGCRSVAEVDRELVTRDA